MVGGQSHAPASLTPGKTWYKRQCIVCKDRKCIEHCILWLSRPTSNVQNVTSGYWVDRLTGFLLKRPQCTCWVCLKLLQTEILFRFCFLFRKIAKNRPSFHYFNITGQHNHTGESIINPLKPTGYVMHHQFNIQQLYALPTLYLCVLYLSENKQRLVPLTA